jgi:HlyD family secretion protein
MGGGGNDFMMVLLKLAKPGSLVKKGEVVAEFDRQFQLTRLDDYRANLVQHEANIKKVKASQLVYRDWHKQRIRSIKADLDRAQLDLKTAEVRSEIEAERLKLAVEESQARYKQILAEVPLVEQQLNSQMKATVLDRDQSEIELKRAQMNIDRMLLKAPIDGIVVMQSTFRNGEMGQVQEGDMVFAGQYFMQIVDPTSMVVNASVNQVDSEALRVNMKARMRFDAYPNIELRGRILGIGAMTRPGMWRPTYMREVPVKLRLEEMDPRIIPDLSASADVILAAETGQASIAPLGSLFQDSDSRPFVFLRDPSGFIRREVEPGLRNNIAVAVRSGLKPGDVVALDRPHSVELK